MNKQKYYHFLSSEYAIHDLERKMIRVSTLDTLNDPFELMPYLRYGSGKKIRHYMDVRNKISTEYGLLCFSRTWEEPLLWSYYADKHKGIAIGFEISGYEVFDIDYDPSPIRKQLNLTSDSAINEKLFLELAKVKYHKWEYEKESRLLLKLKNCIKIDGHFFVQFGSNLRVKEVRLGAAYDYKINSSEYIFELATNRGAIVVPCRLERQGYKINRDGRIARTFEKMKEEHQKT
jgi:hypothetical protein